MTSNEWYGKKIQEIIDNGNLCMEKARLLTIKIDEAQFTDGYAVKLHEQVYNKLTEYEETYKDMLEFMGVNIVDVLLQGNMNFGVGLKKRLMS